ncbi:hypothetical protein E4U15_004529 [Claviceps sp. LM218 group G6]|nr:hypothetical protein E4U15_004529 [Claviceps sp. LM218 group G6]
MRRHSTQSPTPREIPAFYADPRILSVFSRQTAAGSQAIFGYGRLDAPSSAVSLGVGIAMSVALGRLALNLQPLLHQIIDGKIAPGRRDDVGTQSCKVVPVISGPEKPSVRK